MLRFHARWVLWLLGIVVALGLVGCASATRSSTALSAAPLPVATRTTTPFVSTGSPTPTVDAAALAAPHWIPLVSTAPADILAAVRQSTLFHLNCPPGADCQSDISDLGTPVLVQTLHTPTSPTGPDCYIVPILSAKNPDPSSNVVGLVSAVLNPAHTAIQVGGISGNSDGPGASWPRVGSADAAIAAVQAQHHVELRTGTHPTLVFLLIDEFALKAGKAIWTGGGKGAADPVWLIQGTDGKSHIVGTDGRVYYISQIPLMRRR